MAAEQAEIASDVDVDLDERVEILRKVNRTLSTLQKSTADLVELITALNQGQHRRIKDKDENGEPTWAYAVKRSVPVDMFLTKKFIEYGARFEFGEESMRRLMHGHDTYEGFIKYYQRQVGKPNGKWSNWSLVFMKWVRTEHERKKAKQQSGGGATRFGQLRTRG